jgi:hypothetical protein
MAGTETNNFDLVIELAEDALQIWLSALFDGTGSQNSQGNVFEDFFGVSEFTLTASMDRPANIPNLPASATDLLDVNIGITEVATIRMVVGLVVDRTQPTRDRVLVDFANLHHFSLTFVGVTVPGTDVAFQAFLSSSLGAVEIFGAEVNRTTSDARELMQLDTRLIDDTSAQDRDALALLLSFGGSQGGNRNGFNASVLDPGETSGILVFFGWICRMIAPRIQEELEELAPGSVINVVTTATSCEFNGDVVIDEDEDVHLNRLAILLVDGAIRIECKVTKSGFCYSAAGTVAADLTALVETRPPTSEDPEPVGQLRIDWEAQNPDVEIDIPWECYLAAIAVGALTGGIVGVLVGTGTTGIIGAIVGGVIAGLLTWLLEEILEMILEGIGNEARDFVNAVSPNIDVPVPGLELILSEARIDDIKLSAEVRVPQYSPVRCQGSIRLKAGQALDLDTGTSGAKGLLSADIIFGGFTGLQAQCNTRLVRSSARFDSVRRFMLYALPFERRARVPFNDLATQGLDPSGMWQWLPTGNTYAYATTEGRYGILQVTSVSPESATVRYLTFGDAFPKARIVGDFGPKEGTKWGLLPTYKEALALANGARFVPSRVYADFRAAFPGRAVLDQSPEAPTAARSFEWAAAKSKLQILEGGRFGKWVRPVIVKPDQGNFRALTSGLGKNVDCEWSINGVALTQATGTIVVEGVTLSYELNASRIKLRSADLREMNFTLELLAVGDNNQTARASRCMTLRATLARDERFAPPYKIFQKVQKQQFGIISVPSALLRR